MTTETNGSPWASILPTGPILRTANAADYLGLSLATFYEQAAKGRLPKPLKVGDRASGVPRPWLDAVIAARAVEVAV